MSNLTRKERVKLLFECFLIGAVIAVYFLGAALAKSYLLAFFGVIITFFGWQQFKTRFTPLLEYLNQQKQQGN
ncbi:hypothetical protein [Pseudoalteromonas marina]|uniref:Uncharacterized protein n=1 Tax=Pseudoalteromonas marina TaxID=267375 RepID=A0ABT9FI23_9GAMM|nr:hypothetical protein [Pseudoalteromonas marina]MDP2566455.1 hypothetical protein [Pseudoalteromonas marina]